MRNITTHNYIYAHEQNIIQNMRTQTESNYNSLV